MNRSMIIIAIMGISLAATTVTIAQEKRRSSSRQSVHVNGMAGNDILTARRTATKRTVKDGTSNTMMGVYLAAGDVNGDGRSSIRRTESVDKNENITIGGGRTERNGLIVNGTGGNDQVGTQNRRTNTNVVQGNYIGTNAVTTRGNGSSILSGTPTANGTFSRQSNSVVFEGNDEPLWAKARRNSSGTPNAVSTARNVGPDIHGNNVRPKGFANTTCDDQAVLSANKGPSQQLVQGNQIGVNARPRHTGITPDYDLDGDVDGADFLLKDSSQKQKRTASGTQSLAAGIYRRGNP